MSEEIIKVLDALCDKIGIAVDWSAENITPQIVDVITRYGHYLLADAIVWFVFGIALIAISVLIAKKGWNIAVESETNDDSYWYDKEDAAGAISVILIIVAVLCFIIGMCIAFTNVSTIIKCATIPDVYAAEQIIKMLQNGG